MNVTPVVVTNAVRTAAKTAEKFKADFVEERLINRAVRNASSKAFKFLHEVGENNGENLNNVVTAVGTAGVAPIFIVHNPLAKEDKKTKLYSAWRQPISAAIALAVLTPVNNAWNGLLDRIATFERTENMDMSGKPCESILKRKIKEEYKIEKNIFERAQIAYFKEHGTVMPDALKEREWPYVSKKDFYAKRLDKYQDEAFYREVGLKRDSQKYIIEDMVSAEKLEEAKKNPNLKVLTAKDFIKPSELEAAEKDYFANVMKERFNVDINEGEFKKAKITSIETLKKKRVGKKLIKQLGIDVKALSKEVEEKGFELAKKRVDEVIKSEIKTKKLTSSILVKMQEDLSRKIVEINKQGYTHEEHTKAIINAKKEVYESALEYLTKKMQSQEVAEIKEVYKEALYKLNKAGCIEKVKFHGLTDEAVMRSVKLKKYQKVIIKNAEKFLKNTKKKSGLIVGLLVLPISCGILNWTYPRFMEKFLPELANAKKSKADGKEAK